MPSIYFAGMALFVATLSVFCTAINLKQLSPLLSRGGIGVPPGRVSILCSAAAVKIGHIASMIVTTFIVTTFFAFMGPQLYLPLAQSNWMPCSIFIVSGALNVWMIAKIFPDRLYVKNFGAATVCAVVETSMILALTAGVNYVVSVFRIGQSLGIEV